MVLTRFYWPVFLFFLYSCSFDFINDSQEEATKDPVYTYRGIIQLDYIENSTKVLNLYFNILQYPAYIIEKEVKPDSFVVTFHHSGQILPFRSNYYQEAKIFGSVHLNFYYEIPSPISVTLHISDKWHSDSIEIFIPIIENIQKLNPRILNAKLDTSKTDRIVQVISLEFDPGLPVQIREAMALFGYTPVSYNGDLVGLDRDNFTMSQQFIIRFPDQVKCQTEVSFLGKPFKTITGLRTEYFRYQKQIIVSGPNNYYNQPFIEMETVIDFD